MKTFKPSLFKAVSALTIFGSSVFSVSALDCADGQYNKSGKCEPCPENTYSMTDCGGLPSTYCSPKDRNSCSSCGYLLPYGAPGSDSWGNCKLFKPQECDEGQFAAAGVLCAPCPPNSYAETGQRSL